MVEFTLGKGEVKTYTPKKGRVLRINHVNMDPTTVKYQRTYVSVRVNTGPALWIGSLTTPYNMQFNLVGMLVCGGEDTITLWHNSSSDVCFIGCEEDDRDMEMDEETGGEEAVALVKKAIKSGPAGTKVSASAAVATDNR